MDLGIAGRKAIVCASSQGLGYACALALAQEGCVVVINGRDDERLQAAARRLRNATGATVQAVGADICTDAGRARLLAACPAKDEKGLDFTKTQREALDKVKSLEQTVQDGAKRAEGADRP